MQPAVHNPHASWKADPGEGRSESLLLYRISRLLLAGGEVRDALDQILRLLAEHLGAKRSMLTIVDRDRAEIAIDVAYGLSEQEVARGRYRLDEGVVGRVVARAKPALVTSLHGEPTFLDRTGARRDEDLSRIAFLCVPVFDRDGCIGALSAEPSTRPDLGLEAELHLMETLAVLIGDAVRRQRDQREEIAALREDRGRNQRARQGAPQTPSMVGSSRAMGELLDLAARVAPSSSTVLVRGESGTGKELVARYIHEHSPRADRPFVAVNCGAMPEQLVESELFGHVRGAFTGAERARRGRFEMADGGTLFLDEVGELPPHVQVKLLRVLQEGELHRVGEELPMSVDVRVVAATNVNLEQAIASGDFREDLYYRLSVFPLFVPALKERRSDITSLADHFVARYCQAYGKEVLRMSTPAIDLLMQYHWPGNVRELENAISRAVLISDDGVIRQHHLPPTLQTGESSGTAPSGSLKERMAAFEHELLVDALKQARGNQSEAARILQTTPRILSYRLKQQGLDPAEYR